MFIGRSSDKRRLCAFEIKVQLYRCTSSVCGIFKSRSDEKINNRAERVP